MRPFVLTLSLTIILAAVVPLNADTPYPGNPPGYEPQTVFTAGQGGYVFYRIPSAVVTKKGTVLIFCEGRRSEWGQHADSGEINIVGRRSTDSGKTWSEPKVVWADGANTCGNPTALVDGTNGRVWLAMTHNLGEDAEGDITKRTAKGTRTVWITYSDDDGESWAKPREITSDVKKPEWTWYATGPGVGIQLARGEHAGRLIIPCNHYVFGPGGGSNAHIIYSDDHGETWRIGGEPATPNFNETQVVELSDGRVMLNMRNSAPGGRKNALRHRGVAISSDGGETFHEVYNDDTLIEPICQGSVVRFTWPVKSQKGRIVFANPTSETERVAMTVRVSYDDGKTWPVSNLFFQGWSAYSSVVPLQDGTIGLIFEAGGRARYERLEFVRMSWDWMSSSKDHLQLARRSICHRTRQSR